MALTGHSGWAGAAIDAVIRIDEELLDGRVGGLILGRVNAIHRADGHTCGGL